jgi:hypothetical protein
LFIFWYFGTYIHSIRFIQYNNRRYSPSPHRQLSSSVGKTFQEVPKRDMNSGQPSKRNTNWASPQPFLKLDNKIANKRKTVCKTQTKYMIFELTYIL